MAAIDRTQQNATWHIKLNGHEIPRWTRIGDMKREVICRKCGVKFIVTGYFSSYGISTKSSDNVLEKCVSTRSLSDLAETGDWPD